MWTYKQSTGELFSADSSLVGVGYSGGGLDADNPSTAIGKNNPSMQSVPFVGPCPEGEYDILAPINSHTHGDYALPLDPDPANDMFGRDHFLMHGDSIPNPGWASEGCIIENRAVRIKVWESGDHRLRVVS